MEYSDEQLVLMIRESEEAKDILYQKYRYIIDIEVRNYLRMASRLLFDYNDLYQEALVGFADALQSYREDKNMALSSFITLCVRRRLQVAIIKAGRTKNKIMNESLSLDYEYNDFKVPLSEVLSDNLANDPLQSMVKEEEFNSLSRKIEAVLSKREYEVYSFLVNGVQLSDIAMVLNLTPKQVDNSIQRIKSKVKDIVEKSK